MAYHCPNCTSDLNYFSFDGNPNGYLMCPKCITSTPVINGIYYFTETDIITDEDPFQSFHFLNKTIKSKRDEYQKFMQQKVSKGLVDPYSAFQPFNESSRSFYPFIHSLKKEILKPNDIILDTWCRTGWSAYFLAAMFPEQQIVSIWEGNKDVLGYQGFDFWFSPEKKPDNLEVIFHDLNTQLPIKTNSVKLVHALDTLHRYKQPTLLPELIRVSCDDGVIIFPHNHLTNSEPIPFFERGEKQLHGLAYKRFFEKYLPTYHRKAYIVSEPGMFALDRQQQLSSDPETTDYNALIAIIPESYETFKLSPYDYHSDEDFSKHFTLINPYLKIDLKHGVVTVEREYLNDVVGEMLDRHPVYQNKLKHTHQYQLSSSQTRIIYLAQHHYSNREIIESIQISKAEFDRETEELVSREIAHVLPLSSTAVLLQSFHTARSTYSVPASHTLVQQILTDDSFTNQPVLINAPDASELSSEDISYLRNQIQYAFKNSGLGAGDQCIISSKPHFEALLTFWAAVEMGIEVAIINTGLPLDIRKELIHDLKGGIVFTDTANFSDLGSLADEIDCAIIVYDDESYDGPDEQLFSSWIDMDDSQPSVENETKIDSTSKAVILFTSGTTGKPKGISLSHGALYRSGKILAETYNWNAEDRLLMVSELDSMSGLRNVAVATQFGGTSVVVPDFKSSGQQVFSIIEAIEKHRVTLLSATPALVSQFIQLGERIKIEIRSLRQVICTGGNLSPKLVEEFQALFNIRVLNYYGLTETTGLCIGETPDVGSHIKRSIGKPIDTVAQIVDDDDQILKPGETGRLRIFNDRMMTGYIHSNDQSDLLLKNGWLYTGDLATCDEEGYFYLKAREREIIKDQAGNIIYLSEVESCLITHEKVKDAAVCGLEDQLGEYLVAYIITQSPDEIDEQLKDQLNNFVGQRLGKNKIPKSIHFLDHFPMNTRGQTDKKALIR